MTKACGHRGVRRRHPDARARSRSRSSAARTRHALIRGIDTSAAGRMPGVVGVMTAKDIRGTNRLKYTGADRPILCDDKVRTLGDAVAIVARRRRRTRRSPRSSAVVVDYEPLPVLDLARRGPGRGRAADPRGPAQPRATAADRSRATPPRPSRRAAAVVEARFSTQINHQAPLEPEVSLAYMEGEGEDAELVVIGRSINIHLAHGARSRTPSAGRPSATRSRSSGGQFGIKVEVITEGIAGRGRAPLQPRRPLRPEPRRIDAHHLQAPPVRHADQARRRRRRAAHRAWRWTSPWTTARTCRSGMVILNRALHMLTELLLRPQRRRDTRASSTRTTRGAARPAGPGRPRPTTRSSAPWTCSPRRWASTRSSSAGATRSARRRPRRPGHVVTEWPFPAPVRRDPAALRGGPPRGGRAPRAGDPSAAASASAPAAFGIAMPGDKSIGRGRARPRRRRDRLRRRRRPGRGQRLDAHASSWRTSSDLPLDMVRLRTREHRGHRRLRPGVRAAASRT